MAIKLSPGTLKIGLINLFKILPSKYAKFVSENNKRLTKNRIKRIVKKFFFKRLLKNSYYPSYY